MCELPKYMIESIMQKPIGLVSKASNLSIPTSAPFLPTTLNNK